MSLVSTAAVRAEMGCPSWVGPNDLISTPCGSRIWRTRCGCISAPPFPMAAPTRAICKGLAETSCWPIAEKASAGVLSGTSEGLGKVPSENGMSKSTVPSNPNFLAWL